MRFGKWLLNNRKVQVSEDCSWMLYGNCFIFQSSFFTSYSKYSSFTSYSRCSSFTSYSKYSPLSPSFSCLMYCKEAWLKEADNQNSRQIFSTIYRVSQILSWFILENRPHGNSSLHGGNAWIIQKILLIFSRTPWWGIKWYWMVNTWDCSWCLPTFSS